MRRFIRRAFVGLLAVALVASGSVLGASSHAATHDDAPRAHHASPDAASVGTSAHHHDAQHESAPQNHPDDHKSKTCCTMCTISSPLPVAAHLLLRFEVSPAEYLSQTLSGIALTIAVDPEIPKRAG
jgi:hypothetical protein